MIGLLVGYVEGIEERDAMPAMLAVVAAALVVTILGILVEFGQVAGLVTVPADLAVSLTFFGPHVGNLIGEGFLATPLTAGIYTLIDGVIGYYAQTAITDVQEMLS